MRRRRPGLNRHQKRAFRVGEARVSGETIAGLIERSRSKDPEERKSAADLLCPCHVRRRREDVWSALYQLLEDPHPGVRRAAWHTLEDGGRPDDPALDVIFERAAEHDSDKGIRRQAAAYLKSRGGQAGFAQAAHARNRYPDRGKCDFCGSTQVPVKSDFDIEIPDDGRMRFGLVCEGCSS